MTLSPLKRRLATLATATLLTISLAPTGVAQAIAPPRN